MADPDTNLKAEFPGALDGDGVVDLATNDVWVYDQTADLWENAGSSPGKKFINAPAFLPYNEKMFYVFELKIELEFTEDSVITTTTEVDISLITNIEATVGRILVVPDVSITIDFAAIPAALGVGGPLRFQSAINYDISTIAPVIST